MDSPWAMIRDISLFCAFGVFVSARRYREGPRPALSEEVATIGVGAALAGSQRPKGNTGQLQVQIIKESNYSSTKCFQNYL